MTRTVVTPRGSQLFTVNVISRVRVKTYRVDLKAFGWNGSCNCAAFKGCAKFVLEHPSYSGDREATQCDHILAALAWVSTNEYPALIERTEKIIDLPTVNERNLVDTGLDGG